MINILFNNAKKKNYCGWMMHIHNNVLLKRYKHLTILCSITQKKKKNYCGWMRIHNNVLLQCYNLHLTVVYLEYNFSNFNKFTLNESMFEFLCSTMSYRKEKEILWLFKRVNNLAF